MTVARATSGLLVYEKKLIMYLVLIVFWKMINDLFIVHLELEFLKFWGFFYFFKVNNLWTKLKNGKIDKVENWWIVIKIEK